MISIERQNKSHAQIVAELRTKVIKLQDLGVLTGDGAELYQAQILSMLEDVERQREKTENAAQKLLEQYHVALGRRQTFTMFRSMIENMLNAYISRAQAELDHQAELDEEQESRVDVDETFRCEVCNRGGFKSQRSVSMHKLRAHNPKSNGSTRS